MRYCLVLLLLSATCIAEDISAHGTADIPALQPLQEQVDGPARSVTAWESAEPPPTPDAGERESVPETAIKVTTFDELVAAQQAAIASGKEATICCAAGKYEVSGMYAFRFTGNITYRGGYRASDWTRPKTLPSTWGKNEGNRYILPERLQTFLDSPMESGESILVAASGSKYAAENWHYPKPPNGGRHLEIDRFAIVGSDNPNTSQPFALFFSYQTSKLHRDLILITRENDGHCYIGSDVFRGGPLRMKGCITYQPYGGWEGNPRPQSIFTTQDGIVPWVIEDSTWIGPSGGGYTRLPSCYTKVGGTFRRCQFIGGDSESYISGKTYFQDNEAGVLLFEECDFNLTRLGYLRNPHIKFTNSTITVKTGAVEVGGAGYGTPESLDFTGTTINIEEGEPLGGLWPQTAEELGATVVRTPHQNLITAPLSAAEYYQQYMNSHTAVMDAINGTLPGLGSL